MKDERIEMEFLIGDEAAADMKKALFGQEVPPKVKGRIKTITRLEENLVRWDFDVFDEDTEEFLCDMWFTCDAGMTCHLRYYLQDIDGLHDISFIQIQEEGPSKWRWAEAVNSLLEGK